MRILIAMIVFAAACGGTKAKPESALVTEGSDQAPTCCCKTLPAVGEKEIIPIYESKGRMECSTANGDCVDEVQCNKAGGTQEAQPGTGGAGDPPPPPVLEPSTSTP
jgi:hypothetical protein